MRDYQFSSVQFMSADDKRKVLRDWIAFLRALGEGYNAEYEDKFGNAMPAPFRKFTKRLYQHLINHCGFIAHYNQYGFYQTYFQHGDDTIRFMFQFTEGGRPAELGGGMAEYADLEEAMILEARPYIAPLATAMREAQKNEDVSMAKSLLAKHGMSVS